MTDYPKFQISKMVGDYNITLRSETIEEFEQQMEVAKPFMDALPTQRTSTKPKKSPTGFCDYHKCDMFTNKNGKLYHMDNTREEGDKFCNGRGYPSDLQKWKEHTQKVKETLYEEKEDVNDIPF
jgi:hypothetical protein